MRTYLKETFSIILSLWLYNSTAQYNHFIFSNTPAYLVESVKQVAQLNDSTSMIVGNLGAIASSTAGWFVSKQNHITSEAWRKVFPKPTVTGLNSYYSVSDIVITDAGKIFIAGDSSQGTIVVSSEYVFLTEINAQGDRLWTKYYAVSNSTDETAIHLHYYNDALTITTNSEILQTDIHGNLITKANLNGTYSYKSDISSIGNTHVINGFSNCTVDEYNNSNTIVNSVNYNVPAHLILLNNSFTYLLGAKGVSKTKTEIVINKSMNSGAQQWQTKIPLNANAIITDMKIFGDKLYIAGTYKVCTNIDTQTTCYGIDSIFMSVIDTSNGNEIDRTIFGDSLFVSTNFNLDSGYNFINPILHQSPQSVIPAIYATRTGYYKIPSIIHGFYMNTTPIIDMIVLYQYVPLSVDAYTGDSRFVIYPNPATSYFEFKTEKVFERLQITDVQGSVVAEQYVNSNYCRYSVEHLRPGIYLVHIFRNGYKSSERFVKY